MRILSDHPLSPLRGLRGHAARRWDYQLGGEIHLREYSLACCALDRIPVGEAGAPLAPINNKTLSRRQHQHWGPTNRQMLQQLLMHHIRAHAPLDRASSVGRRDGHVTGIGAATAARLASERAAVALLALTAPQHVAEEIGAPATNLKLI